MWFGNDFSLQISGSRKISVYKFLDQERFQFTNFWTEDFSLQNSGSRKMLVYKNYNGQICGSTKISVCTFLEEYFSLQILWSKDFINKEFSLQNFHTKQTPNFLKYELKPFGFEIVVSSQLCKLKSCKLKFCKVISL